MTVRIAVSATALVLPGFIQAQGGFNGPGRYEIANLKSGKVLDLDRNDQTTVIQFSARKTDNQFWIVRPAETGFYFIRNAMNGSALDAPSNANSAPVRGLPFTGAPSQQWRIEAGKDGNALIVNRLGKSLDIPDGASRDGLKVQLYDLNGDSNQRFLFRPVAGALGGGWSGPAGPVQRVLCASNNGRRVYCDADTSGSVRMLRQISGPPCQQGETWGYDARGIWVDRGCRAEFEVRAAGGWRRPGRAGGVSTLTCSSDSGGRVHCDANTSGSVRLVRQISGSPCIEGTTWGTDATGIWVTRGCRAEFEVRR